MLYTISFDAGVAFLHLPAVCFLVDLLVAGVGNYTMTFSMIYDGEKKREGGFLS